jgi:flap endonuclease-1
MGVQLSGLLEPKSIELKNLSGRRIAIDAYNALYQFLSIIRQPTGPAYVFDGKPPSFKRSVVEGRIEVREKSRAKWKDALERGELEKARVYAQASSKISSGMVEDAKKLLVNMGIPIVQAPSEGEAQAAQMTLKNDVWAAASQDYDSLLFGATRLVRNVTITGKRKLPRKNMYVTIKPELYDNTILRNLMLTREQLIELSILVGTDYNPKGIEGLGPKKAYKIIREKGSIEKAVSEGLLADFDYVKIREFFLKPPVTEDYSLTWNAPDKEAVIAFLCDERDFSRERVQNALERIESGINRGRSQFSLEKWF